MNKIDMQDSRIVIIGCGNMGSALIGGLIASGFQEKNISATDINAEKRSAVATRYNVSILKNNCTVVTNADVVVLAVKPQSIKGTLQLLNPVLSVQRPLLISIAAGIKIIQLADWTAENMAIVRAMPNMPVLLQAGATVLFANQHTTVLQRALAESVMGSVGLVLWLDDEMLMDVATALSGSGPAYYFLIMEVMEKAAIDLGLSQEQARKLTLQTAFGATKMALQTDQTAESLRKQVTSKGGTTEQALNVLIAGDIEKLFKKALKAAQKRSAELGEVKEQAKNVR